MTLAARVKEQVISQLHRLARLEGHLPPRMALRLRFELQSRLEHELALLPTIVDATRAAVDIGANAGVFTYAFARLCPRVHAFEPLPHLAARLDAARLPGVTVKSVALSDRIGVARLGVPMVDGRARATRASLELDAPPQAFDVSLSTLDAEELRNVGFVKIDVEGHELRVLRGAEATLDRERPRLLVEAEEDRGAHRVTEVIEFLTERRYRGYFYDGEDRRSVELFDSAEHQHARKRTRHAGYINNFWFIPEEDPHMPRERLR